MDLDKLYKSKLDHSHGAGLDAVFAAGHTAGQAKAREEFAAGLGASEPPAPPEGETSDEEKDTEAGEGQKGENTEAGAHAAT
jgi:hypothetical protein